VSAVPFSHACVTVRGESLVTGWGLVACYPVSWAGASALCHWFFTLAGVVPPPPPRFRRALVVFRPGLVRGLCVRCACPA
jgi:hypothetical protein